MQGIQATPTPSVSRSKIVIDLIKVQYTRVRRKRAKNNHAGGGEKESSEEENGTAQAVTQKAAGVHSPGKIKKRHCGTKYKVFHKSLKSIA